MKPLLLEQCLGNHPNILLYLVPVNQNSSDALSTFYLPKLEAIPITCFYDILSDSKQILRISSHKEGNFIIFDDGEKSPMSHTVLAHSKQDLHNKKRGSNEEHQCGAGQIPFECQIRTILTTLEC